jgi:hypothetical protein
VDRGTQVEEPLGKLQSMLAADGYELSWDEPREGRIALEVKAGRDACAECLVPIAVMQEIANQMLLPAGVVVERLTYPPEHHEHAA